MTVAERIKEIETLQAKQFATYMDADRVQELRDGLKVSDLFIYKGCDIPSEWAIKILGFRVVYGSRICDKLEDAYRAGYIKLYRIRKYSRDVEYWELTAKGKALLNH